ncbi:MAG: Membrane-bound lytic murein transglycosylase F [Elusimicrobia bacterium]|nr:Membrane-bound lytic murein transglycosylase F [Elusimicrobiota bacterium]
MNSIIIFFLFFFCFSPYLSASTLTTIQKKGTLIWGGDLQGGEPYVFEDPNNPKQIIGFEVEIAEELARRMGVRSSFKHNAWSSLVPALERGDFDIALNGLEATTERMERALLSDPYYVYSETLAVRKGDSARSLQDLKGRKVATLNQTYAYDLLYKNGFDPSSYGGIYEGVQEPYLDLVNGKIDAVLLDNIIADRYGCPLPGVDCLPQEVARGVYVILMRKGDSDLKGTIDAALLGMRSDGTLERILRKWNLWDHRQTESIPTLGRVDRKRQFSFEQFFLFVKGTLVTLQLSVCSFLLAVPLGFVLASTRIYGRQPFKFFAATYVEIFRGTPVLLQLYILYFGIAPYIKLSAIQAAVLGLGLNYAAYEAEIYRGAFLSLSRGQTEAAQSLGFGTLQTLRYVLFPQAFRVALPPMTNDFIALLKDSSLVGVIAVVELTKRMTIAAVDMRSWFIPGLLCAGFYFSLSFPLARLARILERRLQLDHHPRTV